MAELNHHQEPTFPSKRHPVPDPQQEPPSKAPKLAATLNQTETQEPNPDSNDNNNNNHPAVSATDDCSSLPKKAANDDNEPENDVQFEGEEEEEEDEEDEEDEDDEDEDDDSNGEAVVDRKGKGVMRDDKGKGKMIEEEEDDDDDDDSDDDDGVDSGGDDSDFSDDPLAEVDLNNILPSRTRRRAAQPGVRIARDPAANVGGGDSDDSDA